MSLEYKKLRNKPLLRSIKQYDLIKLIRKLDFLAFLIKGFSNSE